jgi:S1-C subfamily serine protease
VNLKMRRMLCAAALAALGIAVGLTSSAARADEPKTGAPPLAPGATPGAPSAAEPALALQKALQVEQSLVDALAKVRRYSVSVPVYQKDREGRLRAVGGGSGVLVSKAGTVWVITNSHVVNGAHAIEVITHDGVAWPMVVEDQVAQYDIALLRFKDKPKGLKGVEVKRDASMKLSEGAWVFATGNPFLLSGDGQPVSTLGVISGADRILPSEEFFYGNAIQHDAEVNPGNSGGPLWNSRGELIGINGKISMRGGTQGTKQNTGASFAIPIHMVAGYLDTLVKEGNAQAGFLGVVFETFTDKSGNPAGARVVAFQPNSPARGGGAKSNPNALETDDVIQSVYFASSGSVSAKNVDVRTEADLTNALVLYPAETKVTITYKRGTKTLKWSGALAVRG